MQTVTPFTQFWDALNATMHAQCLPELTYGVARDLWTSATMEATREARMIQKRQTRTLRTVQTGDGESVQFYA